MMETTDYLITNPRKLRNTIRRVIERLSKFDKDFPFDNIVITGVSGAIVGGAVASALNKNILVVTGKNENPHRGKNEISGSPKSRMVNKKRTILYVMLDDFISTGRTIRRTLNKFHKILHKDDTQKTSCAGIVLYNEVEKLSYIEYTSFGYEYCQLFCDTEYKKNIKLQKHNKHKIIIYTHTFGDVDVEIPILRTGTVPR